MTDRFDVIMVAEPRFAGGTAQAMLADLDAFLGLGLTVGVALVTSGFFKDAPDTPHPEIMALGDRNGVTFIPDGAAATADFAFFHHPLAFAHPLAQRFQFKARRAVLVAHHPCFRGDGSLEYNPVLVSRRVQVACGATVWWAPVSGVVRAQLRSFCPLIRLTSEDWGNLFDPEGWTSARPAFEGARPVVGRHSRPDRLKWPSTAGAVADSLATPSGWSVRVMGWPRDGFPFDVPTAAEWEMLPFNGEPVRDFLGTLDVFAYHFSDVWVEAFGRTIVEAMLMERPCILDPRLRVTFGDLATYCVPADVSSALQTLQADPSAARAQARSARRAILRRVSSDAMPARLDALRSDPGTQARHGEKSASAMQTLRKTIGLARRERRN